MDTLTKHVLSLRDTPAASALRRGGSDTTATYAYPYLAWSWEGRIWRRTPALRFAALAATHRNIPHLDGENLGRYLAELANETMAQTSVMRRLDLAQDAKLERFHQLLRGLLAASSRQGHGLDWDALLQLYELWDHPNRSLRQTTRRRLLETYHQTLHHRTSQAPNFDTKDKS